MVDQQIPQGVRTPFVVAEGDGEVAVVERRAGGVEAGCKAARRRRGNKGFNATTVPRVRRWLRR